MAKNSSNPEAETPQEAETSGQSSAAAAHRKHKAKRFAASVIADKGTEGDRIALVSRPMDVYVGRPNPRRFCRFHPTLEFPIFVFEDPNVDDEDDLPTTYVLTQDIAAKLDPDDVRRGTLFVYVYRSSRPRPCLWLALDAIPGSRLSEDWYDARIDIIGVAKNEWTRIKRSPDKKVCAYEPIHPLSAHYGDPDWDRILQGREIEELVEIAFGKNVIDDLDHPAIADFLGV